MSETAQAKALDGSMFYVRLVYAKTNDKKYKPHTAINNLHFSPNRYMIYSMFS